MSDQDFTPFCVGPYRCVQRLGIGRSGELFSAVHQPSGRSCAVRRLRSEVAAEAEVTAALLGTVLRIKELSHPNVVPVRDVLREQGETFIVTDYVRGVPLSVLLQRLRDTQPLPASLATFIASQICQALYHVHHLRVQPGPAVAPLIHGALSPSNVLLGFGGEVGVTDFGAWVVPTDTHQGERFAAVHAQFAYRSPEHVNGDALTPASDIFCVGILLFEMLTSRCPFLGNDLLETLKLVEEARLPAAATIPPTLVPVLERCLAKDPAERLADPAVLISELAVAVPGAGAREVRRELASLLRAFSNAAEHSSPELARTPVASAPPLRPLAASLPEDVDQPTCINPASVTEALVALSKDSTDPSPLERMVNPSALVSVDPNDDVLTRIDPVNLELPGAALLKGDAEPAVLVPPLAVADDEMPTRISMSTPSPEEGAWDDRVQGEIEAKTAERPEGPLAAESTEPSSGAFAAASSALPQGAEPAGGAPASRPRVATSPPGPKPSTPRPSTHQSSTPRPSTHQSSTPRPSTHQSSTPRPSTHQSSTPRPSAHQSSTPRPSAHQSSTPRPSGSKQSVPSGMLRFEPGPLQAPGSGEATVARSPILDTGEYSSDDPTLQALMRPGERPSAPTLSPQAQQASARGPVDDGPTLSLKVPPEAAAAVADQSEIFGGADEEEPTVQAPHLAAARAARALRAGSAPCAASVPSRATPSPRPYGDEVRLQPAPSEAGGPAPLHWLPGAQATTGSLSEGPTAPSPAFSRKDNSDTGIAPAPEPSLIRPFSELGLAAAPADGESFGYQADGASQGSFGTEDSFFSAVSAEPSLEHSRAEAQRRFSAAHLLLLVAIIVFLIALTLLIHRLTKRSAPVSHRTLVQRLDGDVAPLHTRALGVDSGPEKRDAASQQRSRSAPDGSADALLHSSGEHLKQLLYGEMPGGTLKVSSSPPGVVFVDGKRVGEAPATAQLTPGGRAYVVVMADGYARYQQTVELPSNRGVRVNVALTKATYAKALGKKRGWLVVRCAESPAYQLLIDSHDTGTACPGKIAFRLKPGRHSLKFVGTSANSTQQRRVQIQQGLKTWVWAPRE